MITGLRIMNRLRKCSKQLKHAKAFLGGITSAKVSNYSKNPTKLNAIGFEMDKAQSWGMGFIENTKTSLLLAYKHSASICVIPAVEREQEV